MNARFQVGPRGSSRCKPGDRNLGVVIAARKRASEKEDEERKGVVK